MVDVHIAREPKIQTPADAQVPTPMPGPRRLVAYRKAFPMSISRIVVAGLLIAAVAGCDKPAPTAAPVRPVRAVTVECCASGETVSLTGQVRAKDNASISFRIGGRVTVRPVNLGDVLAPGQLVARLDPQDQENTLRTAKANLVAAQAKLTQTQLAFWRKQELLKNGWGTRAAYDEADESLKTAQANLNSAQAKVALAQDQLGYTTLLADAPGVVTKTGAEPGEVVQQGQMVVYVARQGGRDAIFNVPEEYI